MPQKMNRRERKKLHTIQTISEIGLKLFFNKGVNETTISEIMEEADLGMGTFYNYFDSKEAILRYCLTERIDSAKQIREDILTSPLTATQKLSQILQVVGKTYDENQPLINLYIKFYRNPNKVDRKPTHGARFKEILSIIILEGQANNEFRKDIPPDIISEMFSGILKSTMSSSLELPFMDNINFKLSLLFEGVIKQKDNKVI